MRASLRVLLLTITSLPRIAGAEVVITEGTNISVDTASDGRIATDLLGRVWVLPRHGGEGRAIIGEGYPASRPRWSPDDESILYQSRAAQRAGLRLYRLADGRDESLSSARYPDQYPDWHPDGERIVFASRRRQSGFDIWELDLETRLAWRLTQLPGNETEPAWSSDGRNLVYIHEHDGRWSLMLRRHGRPDEALVTGQAPLAAPSWRPDGSLVTYLKLGEEGWTVWMSILSSPPVDHPMIRDDDLFIAPVAWLDRQLMLYTASGRIRERRFDSWTSVIVPFRASVGRPRAPQAEPAVERTLPPSPEHDSRTIIHAARLFDGLGDGYRRDADIVIDGGSITAIDAHGPRDDGIRIDLGDVTVLPGFVDAYASLPGDADAALGPLLLAMGVTTLVAEHAQADSLDTIWSGREVPGPRILSASRLTTLPPDGDLPWLLTLRGEDGVDDSERSRLQALRQQGVAVLADSWQAGLRSGATLLLASGARPTSPAGRRYQDVQLANGAGQITFVSGLADATTPNLEDIWQRSRPAALIAPFIAANARLAAKPDLDAAKSRLVLGSRPNGLPPGIGLHAELRAMIAAGANTRQALQAAGVNSAAALGLASRIGRIESGAAADLVIVGGDPLARIEDALNVVAVVKNGHFYSLSGLIDRAENAENVE